MTAPCELPAGVTFDGMWPETTIAAFTDRDPASASYGASFDLDTVGLTTAGLIAKRAEKQCQFAQAAA